MNRDAAGFDLVNARECCAASAAVYSAETIQAAATDTHCLVRDSGDYVLIAFRGSRSIRNWITDGEFRRKTLLVRFGSLMAEAHAGFLAAYENILLPLSDYLGKIRAAEREIFITGHSLGGALAILCALDLTRQGRKVAQVYTFGQPRVGNAAFATLYSGAGGLPATLGARTFRVVYAEDIVPRVPHLPSLTDPYVHLGTEIFFSALAAQPWIDPPWPRLLASDIWGLYRAWCLRRFAGAAEPMRDHHIANYVEALL